MNFNDIPLRIPNLKKIEEKAKLLSEEFLAAKTADEALKVVKKYFKYYDEISTQFIVISIRYSINTEDKKIKKASDYCDEISPVIGNISNNFQRLLLKSKFRPELEAKLGKHLFDLYEVGDKIMDEKIIPELIEENKLVTKYETLLASAKIPFGDEVLSLTQLGKYMVSKDRETRIKGAKAYWGFLEEHDAEIGEIYDKLVKLRTEIAHKLGFKSFTELGYLRMSRLDYNAEMVKGYREQIHEVVVPEAEKLIKRQLKRTHMKEALFVDLNLTFLSGNPTPKGDTAHLVKCAQKMYHEMDETAGKFFDFMVESNLLDLDAKHGKMGGGYMTYLPKYKAPFIFANSNGTAQDVDTLTHEVGHAFQGYLASSIKVPEYRTPTMEGAEIDSMSMEFFAYPWMESFFKEDTEKYIYEHLSGAILFLPYGVEVDEFQHFVYEHPEATHEERCAYWRELDKKYRPWIKYGDFEYLEKGRYWVRQSHIFGSPFYYIDYTLAQVLALQFKCEMDKNREKAFKKYIKLLKMGGKYPFIELITRAHLNNPFVDGNVKKVIKPQIKVLKSIDDSKL
ncbi:MAG: M3 family oligoendopeptidase [Bacilli bacterium]|nr:M3 family oligoendopeptidase [Bacilli bacterium]